MSWQPNNGYWTSETFSDSKGLSLGDKQTVTGGVLTLLPNQVSSNFYRQNWPSISGWSFTNPMTSISILQSGFSFYTGSVNGNVRLGSQNSVFSAGAWRIRTPYPTEVGGNYTNIPQEALTLFSGSPYSDLYNYLNAGGDKFTLEIDVASTFNVSGQSGLIGFTGDNRNNISGLPALTGFINHGIYLDLNNTWDYLEISPEGIRSINHPELAIPESFLNVKRIRVGVSNQDLYISTESSKTVVGLGKIDTPKLAAGSSMGISLGAPPISGFGFSFSGIDSIVGDSLWSNIRVVTGELAIDLPSGLSQEFTKAPQTATTSGFSPQIGISNFSHAVIDFTPYKNGQTTLYARYFDEDSSLWVDEISETLSGKSSPLIMDLNNFPIKSYPNSSNLISFKIVQESDGIGLPPVLDEISIYSNKDNAYLNIQPNWKPVTHASEHLLSIEERSFKDQDPYKEVWSSLLINVPGKLGNTTGFIEDTNLKVETTGEIIQAGRFGFALRNYVVTSGIAIEGSAAEDYFGRGVYVSNFFPNPFLEGPYRTLTGEPSYVEGKSFGQLASNLFIPTEYTGSSVINYRKKQVSRLNQEAILNRINRYSNNSLSVDNQYVQSIETVPTSLSNLYEGNEGIEIRIPSGIVTPNSFFNFDLQIEKGQKLKVDVTGAGVSFDPVELDSSQFSNYSNLSVPFSTSNSGEVSLILSVPSGTNAIEYLFNIDNITCKPYELYYSRVTGVPHYLHQSGISNTLPILGDTASSPKKAQTVFYCDYFLESYPSQTGILFQSLNEEDKGFKILVNNKGNVTVDYDLASQAYASGLNGGLLPESSLPTQSITWSGNLPLGKWFNLGFIHQVKNYNNMAAAKYAAEFYPYNFVSSNRTYLTLDGKPLVSEDCSRNWISAIGDPAPYVNYIVGGIGKSTILSGMFGSFDALHLKRPAASDCEVELAVKGARSSNPYFVPDVYLKPNNVKDTMLSGITLLSFNMHIGSIYNFHNPKYPHWDHGPLGNHLIADEVFLSTDSPYSGQGSTSIPSSSEAIAPYSSAFDRLFNSNIRTSVTGFFVADTFNRGALEVIGWVKPEETGVFFSLLEDINNKTGEALHFIADEYLKIGRYLSDQTYDWMATGQPMTTGEWSWFASRMFLGDYSGAGHNTNYSGIIKDASGNKYSYSGNGAGFRYYGQSGDSKSSCLRFGGYSNIKVCDWAVNLFDRRYLDFEYSSATGNKGGSFTELMVFDESEDILNKVYTGQFYWDSLSSGRFTVDSSDVVRNFIFSVSCFNNIYSNTWLNEGIQLYDDSVFREVGGYYLSYNDTLLNETFGSIVSPFVIGDLVPSNHINLARIDSPQYTVSSAINTYNLADYSPANLNIYNNGKYMGYLNSGEITDYSGITSINSGSSFIFSGLSNIELNNQSFSKSIELTSISIIDNRLEEPKEAFYYYLIGRGSYGVFVPDAFPHSTGELFAESGAIIDNYLINREKVKNSIYLKDSQGKDLSYTSFPYDVYFSPYSFESIYDQNLIDQDIRIDGLFSLDKSGMLPDGVFSTILVTNKKILNRESSLWVYYKAYDIENDNVIGTKKEIVNASPLFTNRNQENIANYLVKLGDTNRIYDVFIQGVNNGYTGYF